MYDETPYTRLNASMASNALGSVYGVFYQIIGRVSTHPLALVALPPDLGRRNMPSPPESGTDTVFLDPEDPANPPSEYDGDSSREDEEEVEEAYLPEEDEGKISGAEDEEVDFEDVREDPC